EDLRRDAPARGYFYGADGQPVAMLRNPELAATLRLIAAEGPRAFYEGPVARDIALAAGGGMTALDLAGYRAVERPAVCGPYRGHTVCGMGPPSSGGLAVLQILGLLERADFAAATPMSPRAVHLVAEASRLAFADRARYLADSDFVPVPVHGLLAPDYLDGRAALIGAASMGRAEAGEPAFAWPWAPSLGEGRPGTSHLSIVDAWGDAVAMTTTVEGPFGAKRMVRGFLLNNELTDFEFMPVEGGRPAANRVEPGKRPRSSMAPTLVFDSDGRLRLVTGSPGGANIIGYVVKAVVAAIDWTMDPQAAAALPNFGSRNGPTEIESGTALEAIAPELRAMGHDIRLRPLESGIQTIAIGPAGLTGGADPRREGVALGD
ncbi:MAG: gamma-glutamyltransferase, partial [Alphaproteobacteria bacterium]|nr:gamma-glutamyltransferase [Alphaproteobacteria bacterium]